MNDAIYFTATAIVLYLFSDWVLQRVETRLGRRLEHRSLVFFFILLGLALVAFAVLRGIRA